jgi:GT2 family glycosyltransferase
MIPNLIVPTLTRYDLLQRMLSSIDYPVGHVLIIDNGNMIDQLKLPAEIKELTVLTMPANQGVAGSWNLGIKCFPKDSQWLIVSDDVVFPAGALERYADLVDSSKMQFFDVSPKWACFSVGETVVHKAGLACELFHPAYFEDNDWERRIDQAGVVKEILPIQVQHDNSSTLKSGFESKNAETFIANKVVHDERADAGVMSGGEWSLDIRRRNSWD